MAQFIKIYEDKPNEAAIARVVKVLKDGGLVIYPTDTVYGLGCDITNTKALERIARIKGIKLEKANFSFVCSDLSNLSDYVKQIDTTTFKILKRALPGPYTFILPASKQVPKILQSKKSTIGLRIPDNVICHQILAALGNPILSTSLPGEMVEDYTDPEIIHEKFEHLVDFVIDGGIGGMTPSTIVDCTTAEWTILRQGLGDWVG